jgi:hypothetical protein
MAALTIDETVDVNIFGPGSQELQAKGRPALLM